MIKTFIETLPTDLAKNVRSMCGQRGEDWLDSLLELIKKLELHWDISAGEVFSAAGVNYVAPAVSHDGELLVLKINPPYDNTEFVSESAYLRSRDGRGCVRLIEEQIQDRAMLIERAVPGETMYTIFDDREPECIAPAVVVLREITDQATEPPAEAIELDDWFDNLRRSEASEFPVEYSKKALDIYSRLRDSNRTYLHGDFHPRNIVSSTRVPFTMIDPKGLVGDIGYDIGVFLNNFHWWQDDRVDVKARLAVAVRQFAEGFGMTETDVRHWAFAQMVISAWWTFDELPDQYDNEVAMADIWDV